MLNSNLIKEIKSFFRPFPTYKYNKYCRCKVCDYRSFLRGWFDPDDPVGPNFDELDPTRPIELNPMIGFDYNLLSVYSNPAVPELIKKLYEFDKIHDITYVRSEKELFNNPAVDITPTNTNQWYHLNNNPSAIHLLEENPEYCCPNKIAYCNPAGEHMMDKNFKHIRDQMQVNQVENTDLSKNPTAIHWIKENPDKIHLNGLLRNPAAKELIEEYFEKKLSEIKKVIN